MKELRDAGWPKLHSYQGRILCAGVSPAGLSAQAVQVAGPRECAGGRPQTFLAGARAKEDSASGPPTGSPGLAGPGSKRAVPKPRMSVPCGTIGFQNQPLELKILPLVVAAAARSKDCSPASSKRMLQLFMEQFFGISRACRVLPYYVLFAPAADLGCV